MRERIVELRLLLNTKKGHEMKAHQEFVDKNLNNAFTDYYGGFLTIQEIENVIDGKDLWLGKEEVDRRWLLRKEFLSKVA